MDLDFFLSWISCTTLLYTPTDESSARLFWVETKAKNSHKNLMSVLHKDQKSKKLFPTNLSAISGKKVYSAGVVAPQSVPLQACAAYLELFFL